MFSKIFHGVLCVPMLLLFIEKLESLVWIHHMLFILPSVNGHLGGLHSGFYEQCCSEHLCTDFVCILIFNCLVYVPGNVIASLCDNLMFNVLKDCQAVL